MKNIFNIWKSLIYILLLSFPFLGTDCNNTTTQVTNENIQGSWRLISSTGGSLHDICPGEIANFQSNGVAVLTCPNQQAIERNYSVSNNVLTFTETQVQYQVALTNNNTTLTLSGLGTVLGRDLEYEKLISYFGNEEKNDNSKGINSSER